MNKLEEIQLIIKEVLLEYKKRTSIEEWLIENEIMLGELLDPKESFEYKKEGKGLFTYKDTSGDVYFVRLVYQALNEPYLELKTGWFENNQISKPKYDPPLAPNSTAKDGNKRSNTVAKIYQSEIIPLFINQELTDVFIIKPISFSRYQFAKRLVEKFTPPELVIQYQEYQITINK